MAQSPKLSYPTLDAVRIPTASSSGSIRLLEQVPECRKTITFTGLLRRTLQIQMKRFYQARLEGRGMELSCCLWVLHSSGTATHWTIQKLSTPSPVGVVRRPHCSGMTSDGPGRGTLQGLSVEILEQSFLMDVGQDPKEGGGSNDLLDLLLDRVGRGLLSGQL